MDFEFSQGLAALAGIIPLTIIYLLKPRPKNVILPSLMFVRRISQNVLDSRRTVSKKITDPLFFIQLLTLILLSTAIAGPLLEEVKADSEKVIIIMDSSASMTARDRVDAAKAIAIDSLAEENTIISAESIPVVLAKGLDADDAKEVIDSLEMRNTPADIPKAILTVVNEKENENGKIVVISDFENWAGRAPETYIRIANTRNMELEFRQVGDKTANYAIVDGYLKDRNDGTYEYTCTVKNFNNKSADLEVQLEGGTDSSGTEVSSSVQLAGFGAQQIKFSNIPQGTSTVRILNEDAIPCDNIAYISIPEVKPKKVLVLTDPEETAGKSPLITVISLLPDIQLEVRQTLPDNVTEYDTIIVNSKEKSLPTLDVLEIVAYAKSGKDLIVIGNECLYDSLPMHGLYSVLPVDIISVEDEGSHTIETAGSGKNIFEDVTFGEVYLRRFLVTTPKEGASVLAEVKGTGPLVSMQSIKNGTVTYVGFSDTTGKEAWNNFATTPTYPVFWVKLLRYMWGVGDISETNVNTGRYQAFDQDVLINTPTETVSSSFVYYDECGLYSLNQKTVAANLYDSMESNTFTEERLNLTGENGEIKKLELRTKSPDKPRKYLIYALLLLLIIENAVMFRRRII
ncbi:vWA domain-containing protein [Methanosarcina siciliae]|nr:BatA and WFA domain-containing protein [Methanosarcina siciliae]